MTYSDNVSSATSQRAALEHSGLDSVIPEVELTLRRRVFPLGFPLDLETNSQDVLEAASEGWELFTQAFDDAPVRLSVAVVDADAAPERSMPHFFWREHLMSIIDSPHNFMLCD